ncbi:MAG: prepilin peptidase [Alphaproteobacteria bacterium]|nr:prepilin peptidase [Alphaproteobacteria bacterium]
MFLYIFYAMFILLILLAIYLAYKIGAADMRRRIIPDAYLFPLMIIGAVLTTFFPWPHDIGAGVMGMAFGYIMAAVVGLIFDRIITRHNPGADTPIGMGDIKLIAVGGLWCGPLGLAISLVLACIFGAAWAYRKKQKFIPFAPFFIIGGILSLIITAFLL